MNHTYSLKCTSMYFPNLLELSFLTVFAFPKDSSKGLASRICSVMRLLGDLFTAAKYCIISLVLSVLPAPLSPLQQIDPIRSEARITPINGRAVVFE
uniref:Uncharacterized protein n=1 Tax=Nephila pilipes TaxID=299642 RepID=A0A8X6JUW6_NEPPI|nr:hypothetical protein NPIL_219851 [Nephila pilipes]